VKDFKLYWDSEIYPDPLDTRHYPFEVSLTYREETAVLMHQFRRIIPDKSRSKNSADDNNVDGHQFENWHQVVNMLLVPVFGKLSFNLTMA
jgi:hypothetical protein